MILRRCGPMMDRTYKAALELLKSRRRVARPDGRIPDSRRSTSRGEVLKGRPSIEGMRAWLNKLGHTDDTIDSLNVIHVAGTKGKGSTCAFIEALLAAHRRRTGIPSKYGLYTSPSLYEETERIRIDSANIERDVFATNVFEVWDRLDPEGTPDHALPRYLQLMLLTGIHTFIQQKIPVVILETHHGGQYDSTNLFPRPVVTGITSLGMDHVEQLGPTISDIAWHKSGIFKPQRPAFASDLQPDAARKVLLQRAKDVDIELSFVDVDHDLPTHHVLQPSVQRYNFSLAKALMHTYLQSTAGGGASGLTSEDVVTSLDMVQIRGRFQHQHWMGVDWFLDGAHNAMSIGKPVDWFAHEIREVSNFASARPARDDDLRPHLILVFSHISSERDGEDVLQALIENVNANKLTFDDVIFCYDGVREDGSLKKDRNFGEASLHDHYDSIWSTSMNGSGQVTNTSTIAETISAVRKISALHDKTFVLATGSFHLVGGILGERAQA